MSRPVLGAALAVAVLVFAGAQAPAQNLAQWVLNGTLDSSNPFPVTSTAANCDAGDLERSSALTPATFASAFVANDWPAGPIDLAKYLEFSVSADGGFTITPQVVRFSLYNNQFGTSDWEIRSSIDGFTAALDSGTATSLAPSGEVVNANVSGVGIVPGRVYFRLYTHGNTGSLNPLRRGLRGSSFGGQDLTVLGTVGVAPVTFLTPQTAYLEDFESGTGAWTIRDSSGSPWEYGVPRGTVLSAAFSGTRALAVNLDGPYEDSTVTSLDATFDFTTFTTDPLFRAQLWYDTENGWDGVNVQVDTGSGFTTVGALGDAFNWYNSFPVNSLPSARGWTSDSGGWVDVAHALDGVAGTVATVRINFGSDGVNVIGEGAMIDDIRIVNAPIVVSPVTAYMDDFEAGAGGWQTSGVGTQWEHGVPSGGVIDSALSGAHCFMTDLDGGYISSTRSSVERTFDLRLLPTDPIFGFQLFVDAEFGWDGVNVEIDTGSGFAVLGSTADILGNWYDDSDVDGLGANVDGWSGPSSGWFTAAHTLDGTAGTLATIRINFGADPSIAVGRGAAIDDVTVRGQGPRHPGTGEDLETLYSLSSEGPFLTDNGLTDEVDVDPGGLISVSHFTPGSTFLGRDFIALGSLAPMGASPLEVLPGIFLGSSSTFLVTPPPAPGIGAVKLVTGGYNYGFIHPGGAVSGFSLFLQGIVLDSIASNSIYASTDTLEVRLN